MSQKKSKACGLDPLTSKRSSSIWSITIAAGGLFLVAALLFVYRLGHADVRFTDVTEQAGVGDLGVGRGSSFNDYDGDGDLDIFVVNGGRNVLYRNNGDGTFTDVTTSAGLRDKGGYEFGAAFGDYDNDGALDLYIVNGGFIADMLGKADEVTPADLPTPNTLYRNDGRGIFTDVTDLAGVGDPGWGFAGIWADFDGDGWLDLYVTNVAGPNVLYHNNREGTFTDIAPTAGVDNPYSGIGAVASDYDNDGDLDLLVANFRQPSTLYRNDRDGTFTDVTKTAGIGTSIAGFVPVFADFDRDGYLDVYVTAFNNIGGPWSRPKPGGRNILYHNNGDGTFTNITSSAGVGYLGGTMGVAVADYDNDGYLDIYLANGGPEENRREANILYHNHGDGTFADVTAAAGVGDVGASHGVSWGDYDADGDLDLYVPNGQMYLDQGQRNTLYRNEGGNTNHGLIVKTVGRISNRDGIGARVTVVIGARSQIAEVSGGSGLCSQNSFPVEFGLGKATMVDSVIIRWPSGLVQTLTEVGIDQTITVVEGEGGRLSYVGPNYRAEEARVTPMNVMADGRMGTLSVRVLLAPLQRSGVRITRVTADLTPVGGTGAVPMHDDGTHGDAIPDDGTYTTLFAVSPGVSHGKKKLTMTVLDSEGRRVSASASIGVFPSQDMVIYGDEVAPDWQIRARAAASDPASQDYVYSGVFSQAIALKGNGYLDYVFTDPEGLDPFGYTAVEGYIHPGRSSVTFLSVFINGSLPGVSLTEDLNGDGGWTRILIPLERTEIGMVLRSLRFRGDVKGTFYLDDLRLVAQPIPTDVLSSPSNDASTPSGYVLLQNYPNPFNFTTIIPFRVQSADIRIALVVYDLLGQRVRTLVKDIQDPGSYAVVWDGRNEQGVPVSSGIYLYRLTVRGATDLQTQKMVLIR